jgi:predicted membrane chloride channel (bestrophin family)
LNHCIMTCERLLASPIPPLYTAHTGRLLMFYLFFLPLALTDVMNPFATVVTTAAVGYAMLGLDEISHLLEQPFKLMPLYHLSKNSMKDVGDALVCQPPALDEVDAAEAPFVPPPYWNKINRTFA